MSNVITISKDRTLVSFAGKDYPGSCLVRTVENGLRPLHNPSQVYYSMNADGSQGKPIQPGIFPSGLWQVEGVQEMADPTGVYGPVVIRLNTQLVRNVWALDAQGGYDHETPEQIMDWFYQIHFCPQKYGIYSDGCEHLLAEADQIALANAVKAVLDSGEDVQVFAET